MDPVLERLIHYQDISLQLARLIARLDEFPRQIEAIDAAVASASTQVVAARDAIADHQKERRRLEMDLQDLETKLRRYNEQLMQVKTNDEYRAMQHEIGGVKAKIGAAEERILLLMEEADAADGRVREEDILLAERRKDAEARKAVLEQERRRLEEEAAGLSRSLEEAKAHLGDDVLGLFERIARSRNGVALARAREERCQECNVRLRPQVFQEIKKNDRLIQCETCKRILYYASDAPATDSPSADAPA